MNKKEKNYKTILKKTIDNKNKTMGIRSVLQYLYKLLTTNVKGKININITQITEDTIEN